MKVWGLLVAAIVCEVAGTLSLKAALDQPAYYAVVAVGYAAAFLLLAAVLRAGMPLGVAYGIWAALGVGCTALLAAVIFDEALTGVMVVGFVLIVGGVLVVEIGSERAGRRLPEETH